MRIGYLVGSDSHARIMPDGAGVDTKGNTDLFLLRTRDPKGYGRIHVTPGYFRQSFRYDLASFDVLLNLVTDADQNPKVLANLVKLLRPYRGRVINRPEQVLRSTREQVAVACAGLPHVVAPRAIRIAPGWTGAGRCPLPRDPAPRRHPYRTGDRGGAERGRARRATGQRAAAHPDRVS